MVKYIYILILFIFIQSCLGSKKTTEKKYKSISTENVLKSNDTTSKEIVSKSIKDEIIVEVPVSDPMTNAKIDEILRKLNTQKKSGNNNYKLYYDSKLRELRAELYVGETRDKVLETNNKVVNEKTFEQEISENSKKIIRIIPWYIWLAIIWLTRKIFLIPIISIFIPGIKGIHTLQDLFNPPNKNNDL